MEFKHIPILRDEIISFLNINPCGTYVDCTVGGAGHSEKICENLGENGTIVCFDKDEEALEVSKKRLEKFACKKIFVHSDFHSYKTQLSLLNITKVDGVLIDLGVSSYQLDNPERGFSYNKNAKLDMRMDRTSEFSAYDIVNFYPKEKLIKIMFDYGEENFAKKIASAIIEHRNTKKIELTSELVDIINSCVPTKNKIDKASVKRVFQAIRIEVNGELDNLSETLYDIIDSLNCGGILCVLTFHSLEDRIVKNVMKRESEDCICDKRLPLCVCGHKAKIKIVTKKPVTASESEILQNSRSKSAKLRVCEKLF